MRGFGGPHRPLSVCRALAQCDIFLKQFLHMLSVVYQSALVADAVEQLFRDQHVAHRLACVPSFSNSECDILLISFSRINWRERQQQSWRGSGLRREQPTGYVFCLILQSFEAPQGLSSSYRFQCHMIVRARHLVLGYRDS